MKRSSTRTKAGMVTPIDILRQTGTKKPAAAAVVTSAPIRVLSAEEEKKERENERKAKEKLEGTSPAPKKKEEGTTPAKEPSQSKSRNNGNNNKTSASRARDVVSVAAAAAAAEDGTSTTKTLFDTIFANDLQQPSRRGVDSNSSTSSNERKEDSADINAVKETINAAAHAAVAAAASNHRLEGRDAAGALKQALENIAHRIEEAATAAIALEIPSLSDHTLGSPSSSSVSDDKKIPKPVAMTENHKDTIIDDEGAVDLPAVTNTNIDTPERVVMRENHKDTIIDDEGAVDLPAVTNNNHDSDASTSGPKQPRVIIVNDNEYASDNDNPYAFTYPTYSDPKASSEYSDALDDWRLPDEDDYMAQYVHRNPQNFPGSESILFTGTVLQRTLISSALLLIGFLVLLGVISYKMYARRKNTSPWAFLHYMTFGIFSAPFYDSATISNSTLNAYTTLTDDQAFPSLASKSSSSTTKKGSWLRRGSLTRSSTSTSTGSNNNIMFSSEKKPLLPEPVVASSSSASSSFRKSGPLRTELRRTSTAQHHQMQIELALQQRQQQQTQGNSFASQHQQAEQEYLQKSFMRRTSI
ncbi:hypothetical protein EC991_007999 [Linnemannia zychae]|nr:hypothetical protein EC991_007999 [Linnemannia zychae]